MAVPRGLGQLYQTNNRGFFKVERVLGGVSAASGNEMRILKTKSLTSMVNVPLFLA